jgi:hypothetical protein
MLHFLAGLEMGDVLLRHGNHFACARIAAPAGIASLHHKGAEAAKLNPVASCQGISNGSEDRIHDMLDVTLVQMGSAQRA